MTEIDTAAPVTSEQHIDVDAAPEAVYDILTRVQEWPRWNPEVKSIDIDGDFDRGATFRWRAGGTSLVSEVREAQRGRVAAWTGRTMGIKAVHVYRFEPLPGGGTRVTTAESWGGVVARVLRHSLQRTLDSALADGLAHLKHEAERA